jgi:hypothetical protein
MASSGNRRPENSGFCWLGIVRTLVVQVLVLLALSGAVVRYLDWSSDAAWAEFNAAAPAAKPHAQSAMPLQSVRKQAPCG